MGCISRENLCPASGDTENVLLQKILQSLNEGAGGGGTVAGVTGLSINGGPFQTGDISIATGSGVQAVNGDAGPLVLLDSGEIPEGANLYYTAARFDTAFAGKSTTNLAEGANLYFTAARVRTTVLTGFVAAPGTVTAADTVLSAFQKLAGNQAGFGTVTSVNGDPGPAVLLDSGEIPEGTNLYFTEARVRATPLTGFVAAPGTVTAADTVLSAFGKVAGVTNDLLNFRDTNAHADASIFINSGATEIVKVIGASTFVQFNTTRLQRGVTNSVLALLSGTGKSDGAFFEAAGDTNATVGYASITTKGQSVGAGSFNILNAPLASTASVTRSTMTWEGNWLHTPIWNDAGATFVAFDVNPTNTASAAGALLGRFRASSVDQWTLSKAGSTVQVGGASFSSSKVLIDATSGAVSINPTVNSTALQILQTTSGSGAPAGILVNTTWNTTGAPFGILVTVTNTASAAGARLLDLVVGAVSQYSVDVSGNSIQLGSATAARMLTGDGTAAAPAFSFTSDLDIGAYRVAANTYGISAGGVLRLSVDTAGVIATVPFRGIDGSAATPAFLFFNDTDTGLFRPAANTLGFSTGGTERFSVSDTLITATLPIQQSNSTALGADPTAATTQWAVGGEWQYRSSAASEGAGQTNRVHNRAAQVTGSGTDYSLTTTMARVDFGTTDAEVVLPTAGTYLIMASIQFLADALSANDNIAAKLRNSTDSVDVGFERDITLGASFYGNIYISQVLTVAASKTIQIFAVNYTAARGSALSVLTNIKYVRLS